jgi:hypothetical protein
MSPREFDGESGFCRQLFGEVYRDTQANISQMGAYELGAEEVLFGGTFRVSGAK